MDFAKQQLLKYGWTEGKGLGKNENGISVALKPKLKFDTAGVGHDSSEQFTYNWWENVYNNAADNINVKKSKTGDVVVDLKSEDSVDITTKKFSLKHVANKKNKKNLEYGSFLKVSKLTADGVVDHEDRIATTSDLVQPVKLANLTDDELLAACGGRTAHKGARHGLKLSGKLSRIEKQEKLLMMHYQQKKCKDALDKDGLNISDENKISNRKKKKKKPDLDSVESTDKVPVYEISYDVEKSTKKRKHKEYKDAFIDAEIAEKRYEYERFKQERKKLKIKKRRKDKELSKISSMLKLCSIDNQKKEVSDDDGFEEGTKKKIKLTVNNEDKKSRKKKKKKLDAYLSCQEDTGFEELVTKIDKKVEEIHSSLIKYDERKIVFEDKRISEISNKLIKNCTV